MRIITERWETKVLIRMAFGQRIKLASVMPIKDQTERWGVYDDTEKKFLEGTDPDGYESEGAAIFNGIVSLSEIFKQKLSVKDES